MTVNEKQLKVVLLLPPAGRYSHFIKKVVGWRRMWGLYSGGWAMSESPDGDPVPPLWPEREYAQRCAAGDWSAYEPRAIELDDALDNMIPMLRAKGIRPGVFFDADVGSVSATADDLERDLRAELQKYL